LINFFTLASYIANLQNKAGVCYMIRQMSQYIKVISKSRNTQLVT